jgi:hypothetical protein
MQNAQPLLINGHQRPLATATATPSATATRQPSAPSYNDSFELNQPLPAYISDPVWPPGEDRPGSAYLEIDEYQAMAAGGNQVLFVCVCLCLFLLSSSLLLFFSSSCLVLSCRVVCLRVLSCLVLSCLVLPCLVLPCLVVGPQKTPWIS